MALLGKVLKSRKVLYTLTSRALSIIEPFSDLLRSLAVMDYVHYP